MATLLIGKRDILNNALFRKYVAYISLNQKETSFKIMATRVEKSKDMSL